MTFDWSSQGYLNAFTTTLSQASNNLTITRTTSPNAANVPMRGAFPANGHIALLVQLWTSTDMSWLAGAARASCVRRHYFPTISNCAQDRTANSLTAFRLSCPPSTMPRQPFFLFFVD